MKKILLLKEVAEYLRTSEDAVMKLLDDNQLAGFKVKNDWRFKEAEIERWISHNTVFSKPKTEKVLIIKVGYSETLDPEINMFTSLGDVLRTTVLLHHYKEAEVTWLVDKVAYPLLEHNPFIKRLLIYDLTSSLQLRSERFDTIINLEKVPGLCALSDSISAWKRFGFRFDEIKGEAEAYDRTEEILSICRIPEMKKSYKNYWQKALYDIVGATWEKQEYVLGFEPVSKITYDVGFNYEVGHKWPVKGWPLKQWKNLEGLMAGKYTITWQSGLNNIKDYINWINSVKVLITSDSLGFHLALALKKKVIALFGPTNPDEVYDYDRAIKICPPEEFKCVPCLSPVCKNDRFCMEYITPSEVQRKLEKLMEGL